MAASTNSCSSLTPYLLQFRRDRLERIRNEVSREIGALDNTDLTVAEQRRARRDRRALVERSMRPEERKAIVERSVEAAIANAKIERAAIRIAKARCRRTRGAGYAAIVKGAARTKAIEQHPILWRRYCEAQLAIVNAGVPTELEIECLVDHALRLRDSADMALVDGRLEHLIIALQKGEEGEAELKRFKRIMDSVRGSENLSGEKAKRVEKLQTEAKKIWGKRPEMKTSDVARTIEIRLEPHEKNARGFARRTIVAAISPVRPR